MATDAADGFTVLDWIGTIVTGFAALPLLLFPFKSRSLLGIYKDLGSLDDLPILTRLVTSHWFPVLLGLLVVTGVSAGLQARPLGRRRAFIVGAFVLAGVGYGRRAGLIGGIVL